MFDAIISFQGTTYKLVRDHRGVWGYVPVRRFIRLPDQQDGPRWGAMPAGLEHHGGRRPGHERVSVQ